MDVRLRRKSRWLTVAAALMIVGALAAQYTPTMTAGAAIKAKTKPVLPLIRHVFVIMLENQDYSATFGSPTSDPYLATTLPSEGALLENYYGTGHFSNDNYISFISGQPTNSSAQLDCTTFTPFTSGVLKGLEQGAGCVYPKSIPTVANQLTAKKFTWKAYMEDMGNVPTRESPVCGHPALGKSDPSFNAVAGDGYATRHDPFVYFDSIIDNTKVCDSQVVPLGTTTGALPKGTPAGVTGLVTDLKSLTTTPNFSFITPNLCDDGHDYPCVNETSPTTSAVGDINAWLKTWVPLITSSAAFRQDGLLEITFDEAETPTLDTTACCGETVGPAADPGGNGISGPGGGRIGAVLISPFITPGTVVKTTYNHYSSLASIEDLFGLSRLGLAKTVTTNFDTGIFKPS
jgi:phosphatidylinositol-3-phosphatase